MSFNLSTTARALLTASLLASAHASLSNLVAPGLMPAFNPNTTQYGITRGTACSIPVTATLATATDRLYVASNPTTSGKVSNAWVCDGKTKIDIIVYKGTSWVEAKHYTITMLAAGESIPPEPVTTPTSGTTTSPTPTPTPSPVPTPLPTTGVVSPADAARFLEQASFGPTPASVDRVAQIGYSAWIDEQLALPESAYPATNSLGGLRAQAFAFAAGAPDQLRQRLAFALGQIVVVSSNKLENYDMTPWQQLISRNTFGNYRTLLKEATLSPVMGFYLDLANSTKPGANAGTGANENYARELLQLFSVGNYRLNADGTVQRGADGTPLPLYDQNTIRSYALALTGWTYPTPAGAQPATYNQPNMFGQMEPREQNHDRTAKSLLGGVTLPAGQSAQMDVDGVVDSLFNHPQHAPFVVTRLIKSLVTSNPSPAYVQRVVAVYANNGSGVRGDLKAVVKAILLDSEARGTPTANFGYLKDPVLHSIGLMRALGAGAADPSQYLYAYRDLGEEMLNPPTVFSYYSPNFVLRGTSVFAPAFQIYSPSQALLRANFIQQLLRGEMGPRVDLTPFNAAGNDMQKLMDLVNQRLFYGRMSNSLWQQIITACAAASDANTRAYTALYLAAISGEYAVHH